MRAVALLALVLAPMAQAADVRLLAELPAPVAAYGERFAGECAMADAGRPGANEMLGDTVFGRRDINGDGAPDYLAYACMFGCEAAPFAFVTPGLPCQSGVLLLSDARGYRSIDLPGTVNRVVAGEPLRIVTTRTRFLGDKLCTGEYACAYVYRLDGRRFAPVGLCPLDGCEGLLR